VGQAQGQQAQIKEGSLRICNALSFKRGEAELNNERQSIGRRFRVLACCPAGAVAPGRQCRHNPCRDPLRITGTDQAQDSGDGGGARSPARRIQLVGADGNRRKPIRGAGRAASFGRHAQGWIMARAKWAPRATSGSGGWLD